MAKPKRTADEIYNDQKHIIIDQTMDLITALKDFEHKYADHLDGTDNQSFEVVIKAIRNAGIMAISELNQTKTK